MKTFSFPSGPPLFKFVNLLEKLGLVLWNVLVFDCFPVVFELLPVFFMFLGSCMIRDWFRFLGRTYLSGLLCTSLMLYWCQAWAVHSGVGTWSFHCSPLSFLVRVQHHWWSLPEWAVELWGTKYLCGGYYWGIIMVTTNEVGQCYESSSNFT